MSLGYVDQYDRLVSSMTLVHQLQSMIVTRENITRILEHQHEVVQNLEDLRILLQSAR
jgi:hypothetical protein